MNLKEKDQNELNNHGLSPEEEAQNQPHFEERPRWHRIAAWILVGLMAAGIFFYYYWIAYKY